MVGDSTEIWKDIPGYEGYYQASTFGNIYSILNKKILKPDNIRGYLRVTLCKNAERKKHFVHRIIASTYLANPFNLPFINHKNNIPIDNKYDNLEWCDSKYNNNYGDRLQKMSNALKKQIIQYDLSGNFIKEWDGAIDAQIVTGINRNHICGVCKGKRKSAGNFIWRYKK